MARIVQHHRHVTTSLCFTLESHTPPINRQQCCMNVCEQTWCLWLWSYYSILNSFVQRVDFGPLVCPITFWQSLKWATLFFLKSRGFLLIIVPMIGMFINVLPDWRHVYIYPRSCGLVDFLSLVISTSQNLEYLIWLFCQIDYLGTHMCFTLFTKFTNFFKAAGVHSSLLHKFRLHVQML